VSGRVRACASAGLTVEHVHDLKHHVVEARTQSTAGDDERADLLRRPHDPAAVASAQKRHALSALVRLDHYVLQQQVVGAHAAHLVDALRHVVGRAVRALREERAGEDAGAG
jgi:hypothetical protein